MKIAGIFASLTVAGFLIGILFLSYIESEIIVAIAKFGYLAVFFITFLVELLPQPIGPEASLLTGQVVGLNMPLVVLLVVITSITASFVNFYLGKAFYKRLCKEPVCSSHTKKYKKYGPYGLLISSLGPVPYVPFCWASGAFGLSLVKFVYFGLVPRIIRIIFVSALISNVL